MFGAFVHFIFGWLPHALYVPVMGVLAVAFLIVMIKVLTAIATVVSKLIFFFV